MSGCKYDTPRSIAYVRKLRRHTWLVNAWPSWMLMLRTEVDLDGRRIGYGRREKEEPGAVEAVGEERAVTSGPGADEEKTQI